MDDETLNELVRILSVAYERLCKVRCVGEMIPHFADPLAVAPKPSVHEHVG